MDLILPKEKPVEKSYHYYMFTCHYSDDVRKFYNLCKDNDAIYIVSLTIPFFNVFGHQVSEQFAIIYANDKELDSFIPPYHLSLCRAFVNMDGHKIKNGFKITASSLKKT